MWQQTLIRYLLLGFVVVTGLRACTNFDDPRFHPELALRYHDNGENVFPRAGAALTAGAMEAPGAMLHAAGWVLHVAGLQLGSSGTTSPYVPSYTTSPSATSTPAYSSAALTFHLGTFASSFASGFLTVLLTKGLASIVGWYGGLYQVKWPLRRTTGLLPLIEYRSRAVKSGFLRLQLGCLVLSVTFIFQGGFLEGYVPAVLGFVTGVALPVMPQPIFLALHLLNIDHERIRARLLPPAVEEGEIIRLRVRRDGIIAGAVFKRAYIVIQQGAALSGIGVLDLAQVVGALKRDGHFRDADLVEHYLDQRAADWREQAETAAEEAAEEETRQETGSRAEASSMTRAEALEYLDLNESATREEITTAYKRLMMQNHPDRGGSTFIAKQLNIARKVLLG